MVKLLDKGHSKKIEELIEHFEEKTGCELLLAIANSSDPYPAATLRFAIFSSTIIITIACFILDFKEITYIPLFQLILTILLVFVGMVPLLKKLSLSQMEMKREVDEKALELFQVYGPTRSQHRVCVFFYFSTLEQQVRLLADKEIKEKFAQEDFDTVLQIIQEAFDKKEYYDGIETAIETLEGKILHYYPNKVMSIPPNNMNNQIIWID